MCVCGYERLKKIMRADTIRYDRIHNMITASCIGGAFMSAASSRSTSSLPRGGGVTLWRGGGGCVTGCSDADALNELLALSLYVCFALKPALTNRSSLVSPASLLFAELSREVVLFFPSWRNKKRKNHCCSPSLGEQSFFFLQGDAAFTSVSIYSIYSRIYV
jgi:hypothetical protein